MSNRIEAIVNLLGGLKYAGHIPVVGPDNPETRDELRGGYGGNFISDSMLRDIIADEVFAKKLENISNGEDKPLTKNELAELAELIDARLSALPENYSFYFRMPHSKLAIPETPLGARAKIYTAQNELRKEKHNSQNGKNKSSTPKEGLLGLIETLRKPDPIFNVGDVILEIQASGLITQFSQIKLDNRDPFYLYKVILYLLNVQNTFEDRSTQTESFNQYFSPAFTYKALSADKRHERVFHGDANDFKYTNTKQFHQGLAKGMVELSEFGDFSGRFGLVKKILDKQPSNTPKSVVELQRQLRNAAYWSYESAKADETHSRIILTCTALDALIGSQTDSKEQKAEIISQTTSSSAIREESSKKTIINLYSLRNDIIHGSREINTLNDFNYDDIDSPRNTLYAAQNLLQQYFTVRVRKFNSNGLR